MAKVSETQRGDAFVLRALPSELWALVFSFSSSSTSTSSFTSSSLALDNSIAPSRLRDECTPFASCVFS